MPALILKDRTLVHVDGAEAGHFLQNLITTNVETLGEREARPSALLTPQGKILFDFLISCAPDGGFDLDVRAGIAEDFVKRLTLYKLRAKVSFNIDGDRPVIAGWGGHLPEAALDDKRFPEAAGAWRLYGSGAILDAERSAWDAVRIENGVAESGADFELSDVFPHDVLMDKNDAVDFRKGCYVGQEVVSRMHHRGTARRRPAIVSAETALPATQTSIVAGEKPVGTLGTVVDEKSLAIIRVDRASDALAEEISLSAGGVPVTLAFPDWTGLEFSAGDPSGTDN